VWCSLNEGVMKNVVIKFMKTLNSIKHLKKCTGNITQKQKYTINCLCIYQIYFVLSLCIIFCHGHFIKNKKPLSLLLSYKVVLVEIVVEKVIIIIINC